MKALGGATEGNPLFIREVLLHLVEERKIWQGGQGWIVQLNVEKLGIPDSVRQIVGRRLLRLSAQANRCCRSLPRSTANSRLHRRIGGGTG